MKKMTIEELEELIQTVLPLADIDEDNEGQIIIYTNLKQTRSGKVVQI